MALNSQQQQWLAAARPLAEREGKRLGISPDTILAQSALETGYGQHAPQNNYFGIKGSGGSQQTKEYRNGQWVTENDAFRGYPSMDASFAGYGDFLQNNKRYAPLLQSGNDPEANIAALAQSGYATDPNYANKMRGILRNISGAPAAPASPGKQGAPAQTEIADNNVLRGFDVNRPPQQGLQAFGISAPQGQPLMPAAFTGEGPAAQMAQASTAPLPAAPSESPAQAPVAPAQISPADQQKAQTMQQEAITGVPAFLIPAIS